MATLVFDIETIGESWDAMDSVTQEILTRWIDHTTMSAAERDAALVDLQNGLGFSALTGSIVAIGMYDIERHQGAVYYTGAGGEVDEWQGEYILKQRTEKEMLEDFWEGARSYDAFITFNGRCFDVPFLLHRSIVHRIKPTQNLMTGRYLYQQKLTKHIDLQDQLTFYGALRRKPSLHLFCRAFGIESPKAAGVTGDDVAELFREKKFRDIACYNIRDVQATTELYRLWKNYLVFDESPEEY